MALLAVFVIASVLPQTANAQRRKKAMGGGSGSTQKQQTPATGQQQLPPAATQPPATAKANKRKGKELDEKYQPTNVVTVVKGEGIELVCSWYPPIPNEEMVRVGMRTKNSESKPGAGAGSNTRPGSNARSGSDTRSGSNSKLGADDTPEGHRVSPFILVHDWGRSRQDMSRMATYLQSQGHAVIVPDLRGHGESTVMAGSPDPLDQSNFKKNQVLTAVGDIDQCKRFLLEKNNEGELNIDLLNVVAVGDSCHLAIAWAISDWSWKPMGTIKQGQDVKSLTLFSPTSKFASSALKKFARVPLVSGKGSSPLPMFVFWGAQASDSGPGSQFVTDLRKIRPEAPVEDDMATRWFKQNLFHYAAPRPWNGIQLAGREEARELWVSMNNFVSQKVLVHEQQCPWKLRGAAAILK